MRSLVLLATCAEVPQLDADDRPLLALLEARGLQARAAVWDDPGEEWGAADLVVVRSTWDYHQRREAFLAWAERVPRLLNPASVLRWNTDKSYLRELAAAGLPTVPTTWVGPADRYHPPDAEHVVKPAVSAGAKDTARYAAAEPARSQVHVQRLQRAGRLVMVQPYLPAVDTAGETALLYVAGRYSHAVRKGPILVPGGGMVEGLYAEERIDPREPTRAERALGEDVLDALPFPRAELLYARVDLVPGRDDAPVLLELELTEPSMFLSTAAGAAQRLAEAAAAALGAGDAKARVG